MRTTNERYQRSSNYRSKYFTVNPGYKKDWTHYHCAYCGKKIKKEQAEIDHIFSVHHAKNKLSTRLTMKLFGINNVNSVKNLTASCKQCNKKKGSMGNGWIISGFLGKSIWYHRIMFAIKIAIVLLVLYFIYSYTK